MSCDDLPGLGTTLAHIVATTPELEDMEDSLESQHTNSSSRTPAYAIFSIFYKSQLSQRHIYRSHRGISGKTKENYRLNSCWLKIVFWQEFYLKYPPPTNILPIPLQVSAHRCSRTLAICGERSKNSSWCKIWLAWCHYNVSGEDVVWSVIWDDQSGSSLKTGTSA